MGIEQSRALKLPDNIDQDYEKYKALWKTHTTFVRLGEHDLPFHTIKNLEAAAVLFAGFITRSTITSLNILEVFAGNGIASKIFLSKITIPFTIYKSDVNKFEGSLVCNAVDAIDAAAAIAAVAQPDTLLMISPPPGKEYGDYFCIKKWTEQTNSKYIIFVGELGASDGSDGMYQYLTHHPVWKSIYRDLFAKSVDIFGGPVAKEIFMFAKLQ